MPAQPVKPAKAPETARPLNGAELAELWLPLKNVNGSKGGRQGEPFADLVARDRGKTWVDVRKQLIAGGQSRSLATLWPDWDGNGRPLRWGLAAANEHPIDAALIAASRLAAAKPLSTRATRDVDVAAAAADLLDSLSRPRLSLTQVAEAMPWAYALPELSKQLDEATWWNLLTAILTLHHAALEQTSSASPLQLVAGGELGLVLSWRLGELESCTCSGEQSTRSVLQWLDEGSESIDGALAEGGRCTRLLLASLLRCQRLLKVGFKKKLRKSRRETVAELATWAAAMTHSDGTTVFSAADSAAVNEDIRGNGLLQVAASELQDEAIEQAVQAALGKSKSHGRLAWQVSLPEPALVSDVANLAVLLPEWDVRRGRLAIDFQNDLCRLQMNAGRPLIVDGSWQASLVRDGEQQHADGPWESVCEHTDDDVHYLELQQPWTGGLTLQRHLLVIRDDRCVMLADAVLHDPQEAKGGRRTTSGMKAKGGPSIEYTARLPLHPGLNPEPEADTREYIIGDRKPRAIVSPLALPEWRVGPSPGTFELAADGALVMRMQRQGNLFAPLWFDLHRRRFTRPRTWRQLTVAEELRIVGASEAVAFRVQAGSEQWVIYRNLSDRTARTTLGKHLVADFYCGRFDAGDGSLEELIKVDTT